MVAGEASGDLLGADLITLLAQQAPSLEVEGIGGPRMQAAGCRSLYPMELLSVMGLVEVLGNYLKLAGIRRALADHFLAHPPDIFIGVDAPDFNLELERRLRVHGVKIAHLVSPQVWAWREYRLPKIAAAMDLMLTLFPFEENYYRERGLRAVCIGHPLASRIPLHPHPAGARARLGLPAGKTIIGLMPGSRKQEIERLTRPFLSAADRCRKSGRDMHFVSSLVSDQGLLSVQSAIHQLSLDDLPISLYKGRAHDVLEAADVVLLASGTAALEAMLYKKPMVVAYKVNGLTYTLLKFLVKVPYVSLPNLLARERIVPECLQADCEPERLAAEILKWLDEDASVMSALRQRYERLHLELMRDTAGLAGRHILELARSR
jgi:lipid-A-disaccharide synthase